MHGGTSIRVFLPDGDPEGVRLVYKSHWTGTCLACPRSRYVKARGQRSELRGSGVYVLVGPAEEAEHDARIYVGEGDDLRSRIDAHHANKDFWNRLIAFTSFGQALNKATIRYLEARLLQLAADAGRAELENGNAPSLPPLSEPETVDAESFLEDMLVIYPLLGVNVFEPREQTQTGGRFSLDGPHAKGEGSETDEGFLVFAGALARAEVVGSMPDWVSTLRQSLIDSTILVPTTEGGSLRLQTDYEFKSPSAAAAVLLGRSASGPLEWKDDSGHSLKELREEAVASEPGTESEGPAP